MTGVLAMLYVCIVLDSSKSPGSRMHWAQQINLLYINLRHALRSEVNWSFKHIQLNTKNRETLWICWTIRPTGEVRNEKDVQWIYQSMGSPSTFWLINTWHYCTIVPCSFWTLPVAGLLYFKHQQMQAINWNHNFSASSFVYLFRLCIYSITAYLWWYIYIPSICSCKLITH